MWNADVYNRYGKERMQPSMDLVHRISDRRFKRILDVGCGTGMSTASIAAVWKDSEIIGADLSEEMLEKAREAMPTTTFICRDCSKPLFELGSFDLIFSNAFLQWIPNHEAFIRNSFEMLNEEGVFAAQIPLFDEMPASQCILDAECVLPDSFQCSTMYQVYSAGEYYDIIAKYSGDVSMWITDYCHQMDNHTKILDFLSGTALLPYSEKLNESERRIFLNQVLHNVEKAYPCQQNGKVLFPFKRLFLVGRK